MRGRVGGLMGVVATLASIEAVLSNFGECQKAVTRSHPAYYSSTVPTTIPTAVQRDLYQWRILRVFG